MESLKIFTAYYIDLQENLSNKDKIQLLNYVKEADEGQIKHLLLYGSMTEPLTETELSYIRIIFERDAPLVKIFMSRGDHPELVYSIRDFADKSPQQIMNFVDKLVNKAIEYGERTAPAADTGAMPVGVIGYAALAALILTAGYYVYKNYLSKAARACKGKKGPEKKSCMVKFKRDGIRARIALLDRTKVKCKVTSNPELCVGKINKKVIKLKAKLGEL